MRPMRLLAFAFLVGQFVSADADAADLEQPTECVIALHGMGRTSLSMWFMAKRLVQAGFYTVNFNYPSTELPIEILARETIPDAIRQCPPESSAHIHFVTHSLGGIIVRYFLQDSALPEGSRIVMLAPPNKGSELADRFADKRLYRWLTGPPGGQLGTADTDLPKQLEPVGYEIGIIAGEDSYEPWFSRILPGADDGKVSVESTRLEEMSDFLAIPATHTFIMNDPVAIDATINFLRDGRFN